MSSKKPPKIYLWINAWLQKPLPRFKSPYDRTRVDRDSSIEFLIKALGQDNPYVQSYSDKSTDKTIRGYVSITREMTRDWIVNYGGDHEISNKHTPSRVNNLINAEIITDRLSTVLYATLALLKQKRTETQISYDIDGLTYTMELKPETIVMFFNRSGRRSLKRDAQRPKPKLPWDYIFTENRSQYEDWTKKGGFRLIRDLYKGKIPCLSDNAISQMSSLSHIIIGQTREAAVPILKDKDSRKWMYLGTKYNWSRKSPNVPGVLEHEAKHLADEIILDGVPGNILLKELRAYSEQLNFLMQTKHYPKGIVAYNIYEVENSFIPYISIIESGNGISETHVFQDISDRLHQTIKSLSQYQRGKIERALK